MEQWVDRFIAENPDDALDFVELLENLIITIERLEEGSQPQVYQEISIASYKLILKVRTLERTPELWAATQYK